MIIEARSLPDGAILDADVCIIGTGIAGSCLSLELSKRGLRVVAVEAGSLGNSSHKDMRGEIVDQARHPELHLSRERRLGGTSSLWGGRCAPLDDIDFSHRDYIPYSGWPVRPSEFEAHLIQAHDYLSLGQFSYTARMALGSVEQKILECDFELLDGDKIWRYSLPTRFAPILRREAKRLANLTIITGAPCVGFELRAGSKHVTAAKIALGDEVRSGIVQAPMFVIAGGALESTRLLLRLSQLAELHWRNDWLGRCYMSHFYGTAGWLAISDPKSVQWNFLKTHDDVYARHMLRVREDVQRRLELLNVSFNVEAPEFQNPIHGNAVLSAMYFAKFLMGRRIPIELTRSSSGGQIPLLLNHVKNLILDAHSLPGFGGKWLVHRLLNKRKLPGVTLFSPAGQYRMVYAAEQSPRYDSKITLSSVTDRFGMPLLRVDWRYNRSDADKIVSSIKVADHELNRASGISFHANWNELRETVEAGFAVGTHHIGTTRMSLDPKNGVVDPHCRVHGLKNLYVASSSVFPTSGYANPSLMIAAVALRVARSILSSRHIN